MAQIANISDQVELKSSGDKFYEFLKSKMGCLSQMFPQNLMSYKILEGNGFAHGSVVYWKYDFGSPAEVKQRLRMDDANKSITVECLEGDLFRDFEVFQVKIQVIENGSNNGRSSVQWSVEFVKANEEVAPPHNYLQFGVKVSKGLDAYLCNN